MTQLIDIPEINTLLFDHKRTGFDTSSQKATVVTFKDSSANPVLAHFYAAEKNSANIIFFPSTETPLAQFDGMATSYNQHGIGVLVLSYRGDNNQGKTTTLSEFYEDGQVLFTQAVSWLTESDFTGAKFVMGQSLGSVLAIEAVFQNPDAVKGLLLESPIGLTATYLQNRGLQTDSIPGLEELGFNNLEKIEKIELPTLIFHGAKDEWISIAEAEELQSYSGARTKQFFIIPGAQHDFLYRSGATLYFETIKKFIDTLCGVNTWRQKRRKYLDDQENR